MVPLSRGRRRRALNSRAPARRPSARARDRFTSRWRRAFGQLVFPQGCCLCERTLEDPLLSPVCPECADGLCPLSVPTCPRCGLFLAPSVTPGLCGECRARRRPFRVAVAAAPYEGAFRRALLELKFRRREVLAELLARPAISAFRRASLDHGARAAGEFPAAVVAVPVPFWRGRRRGFNQAELLARPVAREFGIPLAPRGTAPAVPATADAGEPERPPPQRAGSVPGGAAARAARRPAPPAGGRRVHHRKHGGSGGAGAAPRRRRAGRRPDRGPRPKQPVNKVARRSADDASRLTAPLRGARRCASVERALLFLPRAPCQPRASPPSALTPPCPPAAR